MLVSGILSGKVNELYLPLTTRIQNVLPLRVGSRSLLIRKLYFSGLHTLGIWPLLKATLNVSFGFSEFADNRWGSVLWTGEMFKDQWWFGDRLQSIPAVVAICGSICLYCVGIVLQCSIAYPLLLLDYNSFRIQITYRTSETLLNSCKQPHRNHFPLVFILLWSHPRLPAFPEYSSYVLSSSLLFTSFIVSFT